MTDIQLKVIGHFIANHRSDLEFIETFQRFKRRELNAEEYHNDKKGFYQYLKDFRIVRNIYGGKTHDLLKLIKKHVTSSREPSVRKLAQGVYDLKISQPKMLVSLSSKILMLNNPKVIFPYDSKAKIALRFRDSDYDSYLSLIEANRKKIIGQYADTLETISPFLDRAEEGLKHKIGGLKKIRQNRFIDKHLWLSGIHNVDITGQPLRIKKNMELT